MLYMTEYNSQKLKKCKIIYNDHTCITYFDRMFDNLSIKTWIINQMAFMRFSSQHTADLYVVFY